MSNNKKVAKFQTTKPKLQNHTVHKKTNIADPELASQVLKATRKPTQKEKYAGQYSYSRPGGYTKQYGEYVGMSALKQHVPSHLQSFRTPYDKQMAAKYAQMNSVSYGSYLLPDTSMQMTSFSNQNTVENYRGYLGAYAGHVPRRRVMRRRIVNKNAICVC